MRSASRLPLIAQRSGFGFGCVVQRSQFEIVPTFVRSRKFSTVSPPSSLDNLSSQTRKDRVILLVSYIGTDYFGLQVQSKGIPSIEEALYNALYKSGGVLKENYLSDINSALKRIGWARGSRTDKGVHALNNIVSCKLETPYGSFDSDPFGFDIADNINKYLPEIIRVQSVVKVPKSFNPRTQTLMRSYKLLWPREFLGGFSLEELRETFSLFKGKNDYHNFCKASGAYGNMGKVKTQNTEDDIEGNEKESEEDIREEKTPIYDRTLEERFFTVGQNDKEIQVAEILDPASPKTSEWVSFHLIGTSFGMHQIRKMVAYLMMFSHSKLSKDIFPLALNSPYIINIPLAPSIGLYYEGGSYVNRDFMPIDPFGINTNLTSTITVDYPIKQARIRPPPPIPEWGSLMDRIEQGEEPQTVLVHGRKLLQRLLAFKNEKLLPHIQELRKTDDLFKHFVTSTIHSPRYVIPDLEDLKARYKVFVDKREERRKLKKEKWIKEE